VDFPIRHQETADEHLASSASPSDHALGGHGPALLSTSPTSQMQRCPSWNPFESNRIYALQDFMLTKRPLVNNSVFLSFMAFCELVEAQAYIRALKGVSRAL
jgi:hypothetical protein